DLPSGGDNGDVVPGEETADVGERVRDGSPIILPGDRVADEAEVHSGGGKADVVPHGDAVQVVHRPLGVDDGPGGRVEKDRDDHLPGEWDADGCGGPIRRHVLLVDLLDRDQEAQA